MFLICSHCEVRVNAGSPGWLVRAVGFGLLISGSLSRERAHARRRGSVGASVGGRIGVLNGEPRHEDLRLGGGHADTRAPQAEARRRRPSV